MVTGMLLGPTFFQFIGQEDFYASLFNNKQANILSVLEEISYVIFSFVVGARTDLKVIKTSGKLPCLLGVVGFLLPLALAYAGTKLVHRDDILSTYWLPWAAVLAASTSFQVTSVLLEDLKLLNSEIGRLALSSSLINSIISWVYMIYATSFIFSTYISLYANSFALMELSRTILILIIIFVIRPIMYWLMRQIPEGQDIKEIHFFAIMTILYVVCSVSESIGAKSYFGAMVLGLAVPSGPPLGSGLEKKLELFISGLFLPAYIINASRYVNVFNITLNHFTCTLIILVLALSGKFVVALIPWLFRKMPPKDSFTLGLILSSQGFFDVLFFKLYMNFKLINEECYSIMVIIVTINSAIFTPLIHYLYDPSKRYLNYRRRTIQQSNMEITELRIVACIHEEDQCFNLINVLQVTNPTIERPIGVFVLDLMELVGRDHPLLINHQFHRRDSSAYTRTNRIINAFKHYELHNEGKVRHQHFTAITPYASMHDDICTLALQRYASLLIIPFHKSEESRMKAVTRNVLDKAPCSVGLLVDKKIILNWRRQAKHQICVIFVGGPDSREALAYGMRTVENSSNMLKVIRLIAEDEFITDLTDTRLDLKAVTSFLKVYENNQNIDYEEVSVKDGAETSQVLLSIQEDYDFIVVGRRLNPESPLVSGLADWSYIEELGIIGDILASSDIKSNASILVLQQQSTAADLWNKI
ncbi:hypothetical protein NMG60_11036370 [Bertholletia excelsa]